MRTTRQGFERFDEELKLNVGERLGAISLHNQITSILRAAGLITGAFLQGSFRRKTMRSPLHDLDKVLLLRADLAGASPHQVMGRIEAALRPHFEGIMFEYTKHSLKLHLQGCLFSFDAVPAFESDQAENDDVFIANTETGGWEKSNTRALIRVVADRNEQTEGRFVLYVREIKQFVHHRIGEKFPGLHVESIAFLAVAESMAHDRACLQILEKGAELLGGHYYDPTGVDRICDRLDGGIALHARSVFTEAAGKAAQAVELAGRGEHSAAITIWHDLFGPPFEEPRESSAGAAIATAFAGGEVDQLGHVRQPARLPRQVPATRAWHP